MITGDSEEPLSSRLRREGEQSLREAKTWESLVREEQLAEAASAAEALVEETLARSPLQGWLPGSRWRVVAAVDCVRSDPIHYRRWYPELAIRPDGQRGELPFGVVVQPADDPDPFLLLVGRDVVNGDRIPVRVVLCEANKFAAPGTANDWWPRATVTGRQPLARLLAGGVPFEDTALRPPAYGWDL